MKNKQNWIQETFSEFLINKIITDLGGWPKVESDYGVWIMVRGNIPNSSTLTTKLHFGNLCERSILDWHSSRPCARSAGAPSEVARCGLPCDSRRTPVASQDRWPQAESSDARAKTRPLACSR